MPLLDLSALLRLVLVATGLQQTPHAENAAGAEVATAALSRLDVAPRLPLCTAEGCGRVADVGLTCFAHSPHAQVPPLWQRARMWDAALGGDDE